MPNLILFDDDSRDRLLPLTYTRPVCELRCGILSIREKWEKSLGQEVSFITQEYLSDKYPIRIDSDNLVINGSVFPNPRLLRLIRELDFNEALLDGDELVAVRLRKTQFDHLIKEEAIDELVGYELKDTPVQRVTRPWHLFQYAGEQIEADLELLKLEISDAPAGASVYGLRLYLEEGAILQGATVNTETGPVHIGKNATVMEGSLLRGPLTVGDNAVVKMGAKIYGPTVIGPWSKVGGEINNSVITGYSNKAHEGFLGNSVIGQWCNLGADTNNSNLKNNYKNVKLWDYSEERFMDTGLQFCGLVMGDHSKTGINSMFNTGTVVGVACNIYGSGFPRNFIPSFSWGGGAGLKTHRFEDAVETARLVCARRDVALSEAEESILRYIFEEDARFRKS